jgi:FMN phosphatase YigB (HAD superfamily)
MKKDKVILTDCDGVLLDWEYAFDYWMQRHGYVIVHDGVYNMAVKYGILKPDMNRLIRMFNESAAIRKLPPLRDSIKYMKKLHEEHGYIFHAITSLSNDQYAQHLRTKNLRELFGDTAFEKYIYLDTGADKNEALEVYKDTECFWIEDKVENVDLGMKLGLDGILMQHTFNADYAGDARVVRNWKEIYEIIVG